MITFLEYVNGKEIGKNLLDTFGKYKVFLIDGEAIRGSSLENDQFNHFSTHLEFPKLVPNNEIWISKDIEPKERMFLIDNGIYQYKGKEQNKKDWYDYALKKERLERKKVDGLKFKGRYSKDKAPNEIYYKHYCTILSPGDNIEVWLIDGEKVRDIFKTDFIEGGNHFVPYPWVPEHEIWVEKNLPPKEINITILHEYVESSLMKYKHMSYDKAHNIASKVEFYHRNKNWTIKDVESLNRKKALKMASKFSK